MSDAPSPTSPEALADWRDDPVRRAWVINSLRDKASLLRGSANRGARRFPVGNAYHEPSRYLADLYREFAARIEAEITAINRPANPETARLPKRETP